jgi:hypothetical protein
MIGKWNRARRHGAFFHFTVSLPGPALRLVITRLLSANWCGVYLVFCGSLFTGILAKLGTNGRTEATRIAVKQGLFSPSHLPRLE